jgi:hypothetical protein
MFGRLRDGVSLEAAQAELASFGARMARANPATHEHLRPRVLAYAAPTDPLGMFVMGNLFIWIVLLIAGTNVATLMFARTALRESEIVVRNALGASRLRVMGQLFVESLVLSLVSAAAALALATGSSITRWPTSPRTWTGRSGGTWPRPADRALHGPDRHRDCRNRRAAAGHPRYGARGCRRHCAASAAAARRCRSGGYGPG